jgi:hypothetical protein
MTLTPALSLEGRGRKTISIQSLSLPGRGGKTISIQSPLPFGERVRVRGKR